MALKCEVADLSGTAAASAAATAKRSEALQKMVSSRSYRVTILVGKFHIDLNLGCSAILPGQWVATVTINLFLELMELSQQEVFTDQMGHPVLN